MTVTTPVAEVEPHPAPTVPAAEMDRRSTITAPLAEMASPATANADAAELESPVAAPSPFAPPETPAPAAEAAPQSTFSTTAPFPALSSQPTGYAEALTEGALARAPATAATSADSPSAESLRDAVVAALAVAGHASASQLLGSGTWNLDVSSLRIEVAGMGKKMLSLTVNAAAEKIIRQELQRQGGPARFLVVPGEGSGSVKAVAAAPLAGSIQEAALANPLVQRAKEIFNAEVRSVVDLRIK